MNPIFSKDTITDEIYEYIWSLPFEMPVYVFPFRHDSAVLSKEQISIVYVKKCLELRNEMKKNSHENNHISITPKLDGRIDVHVYITRYTHFEEEECCCVTDCGDCGGYVVIENIVNGGSNSNKPNITALPSGSKSSGCVIQHPCLYLSKRLSAT